MTRDMLDKYDPAAIEADWYQRWESAGVFHAEPDASKPFVIAMPPPNITGRAHMGHGSTYTPMDILTRLHRMRGENSVWLPGQDHAAIATQNVIEKELAKEGLTRQDLGREKFLERARQWRKLYGGIIYDQFRALGFGPDWQRDRYTMDDGFSKAVIKVFVDLYREELIYRGTRLINWCPYCGTTLSDSEVEHEERLGTLYYVRYDLADGNANSDVAVALARPPNGIVIATTRPETIFADVAVAVNPDDQRYRSFIGKRVVRPLSPEPIPVIADAAVARDFGTGALKITPGHDFTDAEIGERHNLPVKSVVGFDAKMTADVEEPFRGLDRFDARELAVKTLRERGALVKEEPYRLSVGICYRSDTVVEPLPSLQWFVKMKPLAQPALDAARDGKISFMPPRYARVYEDWLERIRDWCISRQLWWGHRLPVWYCVDGHATVAETTPSACAVCGKRELKQDEDTLDTWFSSGLWPFAILGWPDDTPGLRVWYPTQVMITAREIIFLWVARMVMLGLHFPKQIPFEKVLITPLVFDDQGRKMSKSLGNVVDPMDLVRDYGADATRFGIVNQMHEGQDIRFSIAKCDDARKFCNKIWQAVRFALSAFPELAAERPGLPLPESNALTLADRWMLHRLAATVSEVSAAYDAFDFSEAASRLYTFIWNEICDVFVEIAKDRQPSRAAVLGCALSGVLQLLHPIMPFVTEELWQRLPHRGRFIGDGPWPTTSVGRLDAEADAQMRRLLDFVDAVRALRAIPKIPYRDFRDVLVAGADHGLLDLIRQEAGIVRTLARAERVHSLNGAAQRPAHALSRRMGSIEVLLPVEAEFIEKERAGLRKEIDRLTAEIETIQRKLDTGGFVQKAPPAVVEKERTRVQTLQATLALSRDRLAALSQGSGG